MTLAGWDTGSSAPLLPFLQEYYNVSGVDLLDSVSAVREIADVQINFLISES